jgi:hypothetical protein
MGALQALPTIAERLRTRQAAHEQVQAFGHVVKEDFGYQASHHDFVSVRSVG